MRDHDLPPYAPSLIESMRSIGYSFDSALADVIDNSITAKATTVSIQFRPFDQPYVAIIDNGEGMTADELIVAMEYGHRSPSEVRSEYDLGRYGLGLKTASLSQCRQLTVISLKSGKISACCWNIDYVIKREKWILQILDKKEISDLPHIDDLKTLGHGTIVLWKELDKLIAGETSIEVALGQKLDHARDHLALIFHRYITGEPDLEKLKISINNLDIKGIDPFLRNHKATQVLDEDSFTVEGQKISVKPYILPHLSKLNNEEAKYAGGKDGLRSQQGFYVYRKSRLIIWGTWFKIAGKDELSKLARVRVDIPNSLDHLWTLDIKKSVAHPPETVRRNLKRIIDKIRDASGRTLVFRGKATKQAFAVGWNEISDRDGFRYEVNKDHPFILTLKSQLPEKQHALIDGFMKVLENTLPVDSIYSRLASDHRLTSQIDIEVLKDMINSLITGLEKESKHKILSQIQNVEPFNKHTEIVSKIIQEILK
jgi:hypothetical protein